MSPAGSLVARDDSVLVVIDVQPGFVADDAAAALEKLAWLAGIAAVLDVPAVVTEEEPEVNGATEPRVLERLGGGVAPLVKPTFGLGGTPAIVDAIRSTGRATAVLVGFETDVCVAQSALGLRELGLRVVVVADAVGSDREEHHRAGLARLAQAGVELHHAKGLIYEWLETVERRYAVMAVARERFGEPPPGL